MSSNLAQTQLLTTIFNEILVDYNVSEIVKIYLKDFWVWRVFLKNISDVINVFSAISCDELMSLRLVVHNGVIISKQVIVTNFIYCF